MKACLIIAFMLCSYLSLRVCDENCNKWCKCNSRKVSCTGMNLTYIPKIPLDTFYLEMRNTGLSSILEDGFGSFAKRSIKILTLTGNRLVYIHPKALCGLHLYVLKISFEPLLKVDIFKAALANLPIKKLHTLHLTYNNWARIPEDMFSRLKKNYVKKLALSGNKFTVIRGDAFGSLKNMNKMILSLNLIEEISLIGLPRRLQVLDLSSNSLTKVPHFCTNNELVSAVPKLKVLNLGFNVINNIWMQSFDCLPQMETLILDGVRIRNLRRNVFSNIPNLDKLQISNLDSRLLKIEDFAFNSSSLRILLLEQTKFRFDKRNFNPKIIFSTTRNLQWLSLRHSYLPYNPRKLSEMLLPLVKIQTLMFTSTHLRIIPNVTKFLALENLFLDGNKIGRWTNGNKLFPNTTNMKLLELSGNHITTISETSFPKGLLVSLKQLDLNGNPFACNCDLLWFTEFIQSSKIKFLYYPERYICALPSSLHGKSLIVYVKSEKSCPPWNQLYTLAIALSGCVLFTSALLYIVVKCQANIKNLIYLVKIRRKGYLPLLGDEDFKYDAFVVYCDDDRHWVHHELLNKLEGEGIRLCIHQRDFSAGESIANNVAICLEQSRKVIVILSNEFTKDEWCQWEVDVVHERLRTFGADVFLLIVLKTIDSEHMTSKLRTILDCAPCLRFKAGLGENVFWKATIKAVRKPLGHPPVALL